MSGRGYQVIRSFSILFVVALGLVAVPVGRAQDASQVEIENSKFQAVGSINTNDVFVRSGASENDYATAKLTKGTKVTVVGIRFNWLKIVPPENSFCLVARAYVNRAGNGTVGVVTSTLNVRIGSNLNLLNTKIAKSLEPNQRVEIIGDQDEYFKIKPPADVYVYVNKQYVDLVPETIASAGTANVAPPASPSGFPPTPDIKAPANKFGSDLKFGGSTGVLPEGKQTAAATPSPAPAPQKNSQSADVATLIPLATATQPTASAEAEFESLEATYAEITQKPLDEQPIDELLSGYQKLIANGELPESLRRIADWKSSVLKTRLEDKQQFVTTKKVLEDGRQKQMALRAEQGELEQRVKATDVQFYTAVGTLRTSSLQIGQQILYRLTDPANGRTVVYLRSSDGKLAQMLGQFIGVKGDVASDATLNLRVVSATAFDVINPAKIGQSVVSQICPPSLLPGTASSE